MTGNNKDRNIPFFVILGLVTILFLNLLKPFFFEGNKIKYTEVSPVENCRT